MIAIPDTLYAGSGDLILKEVDEHELKGIPHRGKLFLARTRGPGAARLLL